jgi:hypothetical protein
MVKKKKNYWVKKVQESSFAMDIPEGLFTRSSREVAKGLKKAVLESNRKCNELKTRKLFTP